jgi:phage host-nuclease inhibitor protein Gam
MIALNDNGGAGKPVLKTELEPAAKRFADANTELTELVGELNGKIENLKRAYLPGIKKTVSKAAERHSELKALIEANPSLFDKPRTVVLHGIKLGLQKGKGGIEFDDVEATISRIQTMFGVEAEPYLDWKPTVNKKALADLPVVALKKLGCTVRDTGDEVVIKPVDGDVDKIVRALLKDATEEPA